jgi:tRNA threonylcarbamoyladenosine biosynthesis protein TsaE
MSDKTVKISKDIKENAKIARIFLDKMLKNKSQRQGALVVCLSGDLGAGKTAFVKAVAENLGIKHKINSPTFVIIKKYFLPLRKGSVRRARGSDFRLLFHLDAYRLKNEKELLHLGWEEIINNESHLVFIEWPENVSKIIPSGARFIYISVTENGHRNFELK